MSAKREIAADTNFLGDYFFGDAANEFTFRGTKGPVLALNGIVGGWQKNGLRKFMSKYDVEGKLLFRDFLKEPLSSFIPELGETIKQWDKPTLIGYSAGGLLLLQTVEDYKLWDKIHKLITIATPLNGIDYSFLGLFGQSIQDVEKGSNFIKGIQRIEPPVAKVISVFAEEDRYIPNPYKLDCKWTKLVVDAKSHGDIQNSVEFTEPLLKAVLNIKQ